MRDGQTKANATRELAGVLFKGPCKNVQSKVAGFDPCMMREEERPLTPAEKREGFERRPFWAYDPQRMCPGCRAYWHVEMAAQTLERAEAVDAKTVAVSVFSDVRNDRSGR